MKWCIFYLVIFLSLVSNSCATLDDQEFQSKSETKSESKSETESEYVIEDIIVIDEDVPESVEEVIIVEGEFEKIRTAFINNIDFLEYNYNGIVFKINNIFTNKFNEKLELEYVDISLLTRANTEITKYSRESRIDVSTNENLEYSYQMKITYDEIMNAGININTNINIYSLSGDYTFLIGNKKTFRDVIYYPFRLEIPVIPKPTISVDNVEYKKASEQIYITFEVKMYKPKGFTHLLVSNDNDLTMNGVVINESIARVSDISISSYGIVSFSVSYGLNKGNIGSNLFTILNEGYDVDYMFSTHLIFKDQNDADYTMPLNYSGTIKTM